MSDRLVRHRTLRWSPMKEKIARKMCKWAGDNCEACGCDNKTCSLDLASDAARPLWWNAGFALRAMLEPTPAMIEAGQKDPVTGEMRPGSANCDVNAYDMAGIKEGMTKAEMRYRNMVAAAMTEEKQS